ncbi:unnamed protein product [Adineta steineri]|uniref:Ubiquitin-like domain-containing protein n=1 Tax=Adineta steineri TaxID=433720 RepID=A0A814M9F5_9BILA|nr:unnamed protein product [Adineta steineri]CAF1075829.1 unnamed protein product [Adineta steineri]
MFSVTIDQSSNILQLKTVIYNEGFVTSINEQKLLFLGVELDDDLTIRQCRLNNSSLILLLIQKTENLAVSSDHDQYDRFARKRKSIWEARLGFDDAGERVDEDDDNDGDCDNDDEDEDGDSDDEDEDDDSGDDNVDSDDNQHLHCESNAHSNNQSCTDSYLYRNDESDEDEFITSLVFYYPDLK